MAAGIEGAASDSLGFLVARLFGSAGVRASEGGRLPFSLAGGSAGGLMSEERSGRAVFCKAGALDAEPWYCSSSASRS